MRNLYFLVLVIIFFTFKANAELHLVSPNGGESIHIESGYLIQWEGCEATDTLTIHFSTNNGRDWKFVTDKAINYQYLWENIPLFESENCLLRLTYTKMNNIEVIPPEIEWVKNYGGSKDDEFNSAVISNDGSIYIGGGTDSHDYDITDSLSRNFENWIIKIDQNGNKKWSHIYSENNSNCIDDIIELSNHNILTTGYTWQNPTGDILNWNFEIDTSGSIIKSNVENLNNKLIYSLKEFDNDIFCVGYSIGYDSKVKFSKYDNNLNILFDSTYGTTGEEFGDNGTWAYSLEKTDAEEFVICGYAGGSDGDVGAEVGNGAIWLIKVDTLGNIKWSNVYGGSSSEIGHDIKNSYDGNLFVCGTTKSSDGDINENNGRHDAIIIKIDTAGNIIWLNTIGSSSNDTFNSILPTKDGGVICLGSWNGSIYNFENNPNATVDIFAARYSKEGDLLWQKTYGGNDGEVGKKILQSDDGGYFIIGNSYSDNDTIDNYGETDGIVVKLSPDSIYTHNSDISDDIFSLYSTRSTLLCNNDTFNDMICGNYAEINVDIKNTGIYPLNIDSVRIEGPNKDNFALELNLDGRVISPDYDLQTKVYFNADKLGEQNASLYIYNDSKNRPFIKIPINFTKDSTNIEYADDILKFEGAKQNIEVTQNINITNTGSLPYKFNLPVIVNNFELVSVLPNPILPGQAGTAEIKFLSEEPGEFTDTLSISDTCNISHELLLYADVLYNAKLEYNIADFNDIICEKSVSVPLHIDNLGISNLVIDSTKIIGNDKNDFNLEFTLENEIIPANYFLDVNVIFTPYSAGVKTAELVIYSNAVNEPEIHIPLQAKKDSVGLTFENNTVIFDELNPNIPDTKYLNVTNTGTVDLEFDLPQTINNFEIKSVNPNPVPPGQTAQMEIYFSGADAGTYNEKYYFSDQCENEYELDMEAIVKENNDEITAKFSGFSNLECEYEETKEVNIYNISDTDIEIFSANIEGTNKDEFILEENIDNEIISAGDNLTVNVTFKPKSVGNKSAYLLINTSSTENPELEVVFSCRKDSISLKISVENVEFLGLNEDETASEEITITNTGTVETRIPSSIKSDYFEIKNITPNPIPSNSTATAEVIFAGAKAGIYENSLPVTDDCLNVHYVDMYAEVLENGGEGKYIRYKENSEFQDILCENTSQNEIEISNSGDENLLIEEVFISGEDASSFTLDANYNNQTLLQGEKLTMNIMFSPNKAGLSNAILNIKNNSENNPDMEIPLSAQKDSTGIELIDNELFFENVTINEEKAGTISIKNIGSVNLILPSPVYLNEFTIESISPNPIPAGETAIATISFVADESGDYNEQYTLSDLCGREYTVNLEAEVSNINKPEFSLKVNDASGMAEDIITVTATINDVENNEIADLTSLSGQLTYDHDMLEPVSYSGNVADDNNSYIELENIPFISTNSEISLADFTVKNSNKETSNLELTNITFDKPAIVNTNPGTFTLLREGTNITDINFVNPNPSLNNLEINYTISEAGYTEIYVINILGKNEGYLLKQNISNPGKHTLTVRTDMLSSGFYFLVLKTEETTVTRKIIIME